MTQRKANQRHHLYQAIATSSHQPSLLMFPLLHLPILAFDSLYKFLDDPEKILLSQCSKRLKTIIRDREGPRKRTLEVYIYYEEIIITLLEIKKIPKRTFQWTLSKENDKLEFLDRNIVIDNTPWKVAELTDCFYRRWLTVLEPEAHDSSLLNLLAGFQSVFNLPVHKVYSENRSVVSFAKLFKETSILHSAKSVSMGSSAIHPETMSYIMENFATENLTIFGYAGREYSYQGPLNFSNVHFACATWMTPEVFLTLTSTCKQMELESAVQISDMALNQFIKDWMAGNNRTLEFIEVSRKWSYHVSNFRGFPDPATPLDTSVILEGIEYAPGAKKRTNVSKYFNSFHNYEDGVDIRRSDGLLATVLVIQESCMPQFSFTVWYDPEPNLVEALAN